MTGTKISELPSATTPLTGAELVPVVQSGITDKVTVANVFSSVTGDVSFTTLASKVNSVQANAIVDASLASSSQIYAVNQTYNRTAAEISAGVTPTNYGYPPGNVLRYGADPSGNTDCSTAINNAIAANSNGTTIKFPKGTYKITTAITVPSNVTIEGDGRNFGTTLLPVGCAAFIFNGALYGGGWVFRIEIRNLLIDATSAVATHLISMVSGYNIIFKNIFLYNQTTSVTNGLYASNVNNIVIDDFIAYATSTSVTRFAYIDGVTTGQVSITFNRPDVEVYNRGILATGFVDMNINDPYFEREIVCYDHQITSGQVNIRGGIFSTVNGYGINVAGPNLLVDAVDIDPFTGAVRGGQGINAAATTAYPQVVFKNIPRMSTTGFVNTAQNYMTMVMEPVGSYIPNYYKGTLPLTKTLTSGAATNFLTIANLDAYGKFEITCHANFGVISIIEKYSFVVYGSSNVSGITNTTVLHETSANYTSAWVLTATPNVGAGTVVLAMQATQGGALGAGQSITFRAEVDYVISESGVGGLYLM